MDLCAMMRAFGMVGGLGPSSLCPTGVLPLLGVIAASLGCDMAVEEEEGLYSSLCAHTNAQFHHD